MRSGDAQENEKINMALAVIFLLPQRYTERIGTHGVRINIVNPQSGNANERKPPSPPSTLVPPCSSRQTPLPLNLGSSLPFPSHPIHHVTSITHPASAIPSIGRPPPTHTILRITIGRRRHRVRDLTRHRIREFTPMTTKPTTNTRIQINPNEIR